MMQTLFLFGLAMVLCAVSSAVPQSVTPINNLAAYAGSWKSHTEHFATKFSKAREESTTIRNDCWNSGEYFACHQFVDSNSAALIVFTYSQKDDAYKSYVIPTEGGNATTGKLLIKGNIWTFPWEDKDDTGKTYYFQVVNVWTGPNDIDYRMEFSEDKVHWTVASKGHETKEHEIEVKKP